MSDIVWRLRSTAEIAKNLGVIDGLSATAADEIDRLRAAIKPFADAAADLDDGDTGSLWERPAAMNITCDDLRNCQRILDGSSAAAAALKETGE